MIEYQALLLYSVKGQNILILENSLKLQIATFQILLAIRKQIAERNFSLPNQFGGIESLEFILDTQPLPIPASSLKLAFQNVPKRRCLELMFLNVHVFL